MPHYEYPRPALTVDVVLLSRGDKGLSVLLVRRGRPPFEGRWALPGGFVEIDEDLEAAARRELVEETGLEAEALFQVGAFGRPDRDPRGRVVSIAYVGLLRRSSRHAAAGTDAADARWFLLPALPELAFDHAEIIEAALACPGIGLH